MLTHVRGRGRHRHIGIELPADAKLITGGNFTLLLADYESLQGGKRGRDLSTTSLPRSPVGPPVERSGLVYLSGLELALSDCSVVV